MDTERAAGRLDADRVRAMFDRIAGVYDLMNTVMTAGLHHRWRQRTADMARVGPGDRVLDVATGTGDLAIELARRVTPGGEVVGSDFSEAMLERARAKVRAGDLGKIAQPRKKVRLMDRHELRHVCIPSRFSRLRLNLRTANCLPGG